MTEEEKPNEEPPKEKPKEVPVVEPPAQKPDLIKQANDAALRLEQGNKELATLLAKQEALQVERTLSGTADTGTVKQQTQDEKDIANAKEMLKGTGYENML